MDRTILIEYEHMKNRIKILRERIRKLEREIEDLKEQIASDVVAGGYDFYSHISARCDR